MSSAKNSLVVAKFKAAADMQSLYVVGIIFFDRERGAHMRLRIAAGGDRGIMGANLSGDWQTLESFIINREVASDAAQFLAEDVKAALQSEADNPSLELNNLLRNPSISGELIAAALTTILSRSMDAEGLEVSAEVESVGGDDAPVTASEPALEGPGDSNATVIAAESAVPPVSEILLSVKPEVSPVKGTAIRHLRIGDMIPIFLVNKRSYGKYFPGRYEQGQPIPAFVIVIDASNPNEALLRVKIEEGIFGLSKVHPDVLVSTLSARRRGPSHWLLAVMVILGALLFLGLAFALFAALH